jgi:hypothetical protein
MEPQTPREEFWIFGYGYVRTAPRSGGVAMHGHDVARELMTSQITHLETPSTLRSVTPSHSQRRRQFTIPGLR